MLRDGVRRAEYLVKLGGVDLDSSDPQSGAPHLTQAFLIEMIERRERLDEVRGAGEDGVGLGVGHGGHDNRAIAEQPMRPNKFKQNINHKNQYKQQLNIPNQHKNIFQ